jgi:hypothetical protein
VCIEIGLRWMRASLRGYGGEAPSEAAFFDLLAIEPEASSLAKPSVSAWQSANIELFAVDMADIQGHDEPFEEFASRVERGFLRAAEWLDARPPGAFDQWRAAGRTADIFIGGWLSNDQFDMLLPASFLAACGRAGLPVQICTND